jgi:hypothetical protein
MNTAVPRTGESPAADPAQVTGSRLARSTKGVGPPASSEKYAE